MVIPVISNEQMENLRDYCFVYFCKRSSGFYLVILRKLEPPGSDLFLCLFIIIQKVMAVFSTPSLFHKYHPKLKDKKTQNNLSLIIITITKAIYSRVPLFFRT